MFYLKLEVYSSSLTKRYFKWIHLKSCHR